MVQYFLRCFDSSNRTDELIKSQTGNQQKKLNFLDKVTKINKNLDILGVKIAFESSMDLN